MRAVTRGGMLLAGLLLAAPLALGQSADDGAAVTGAEPPAAATTGGRFPNDPHYAAEGSWGQDFADQWALRQLRVYAEAAQAVAAPTAAEPVVVAVIDTGVDYRHEDLAVDRLWRNPQETRNGRDDDGNGYRDDLIGWNFVDGNNNPWDQSGHGTHIAGVIAACTHNGLGIAGINGEARIMALKVADFAGQASSADVAAAIRYAVDNGARLINLSLGGELVTQLEREAAAYARDAGVLIVVSAGNKGLAADRFGYPALPGVLVVGASGLDDERAGFSNFGAAVDVLAPGVDVLSLRAADTDFIGLTEPLDYEPGAAVVGERGTYYRASGTSFAAATVSGLASRLLWLRPELGAEDLVHVLTQSAVDVDVPGVDQRSGFGRVDLVRALGADPGRYAVARLAGAELELKDQQLWIHVTGTADGADFAGARLEVRADPAAEPPPAEDDDRRKKDQRKSSKRAQEDDSADGWQPAGKPLTAAVTDGRLASVAVDELVRLTGGATHWELRLTVDSGDDVRAGHMRLALPPPPAPDVAATEQ